MNRRMPNGMYGGVRGESKSPLLDFYRTFRNMKARHCFAAGKIWFVIGKTSICGG